MGITRSTGSSLPLPFLPLLLVLCYLRVCLFQPGPCARAEALFKGKSRFGFLNWHQVWDIGGRVGGSRWFSLRLGGFQSIHEHGECRPIGVAHPDDIGLSVRIGAGAPSSALGTRAPFGIRLRVDAPVWALSLHEARFRSGVPVWTRVLCTSRSRFVRRGWRSFSFSLPLGLVLPVEPKSSSTRFQHISSSAGFSPSRGYEARALEPTCVRPRDERLVPCGLPTLGRHTVQRFPRVR
jgi:hypothetical protein